MESRRPGRRSLRRPGAGRPRRSRLRKKRGTRSVGRSDGCRRLRRATLRRSRPPIRSRRRRPRRRPRRDIRRRRLCIGRSSLRTWVCRRGWRTPSRRRTIRGRFRRTSGRRTSAATRSVRLISRSWRPWRRPAIGLAWDTSRRRNSLARRRSRRRRSRLRPRLRRAMGRPFLSSCRCCGTLFIRRSGNGPRTGCRPTTGGRSRRSSRHCSRQRGRIRHRWSGRCASGPWRR